MMNNVKILHLLILLEMYCNICIRGIIIFRKLNKKNYTNVIRLELSLNYLWFIGKLAIID